MPNEVRSTTHTTPVPGPRVVWQCTEPAKAYDGWGCDDGGH